jgi:hypothetical protein
VSCRCQSPASRRRPGSTWARQAVADRNHQGAIACDGDRLAIARPRAGSSAPLAAALLGSRIRTAHPMAMALIALVMTKKRRRGPSGRLRASDSDARSARVPRGAPSSPPRSARL